MSYFVASKATFLTISLVDWFCNWFFFYYLKFYNLITFIFFAFPFSTSYFLTLTDSFREWLSKILFCKFLRHHWASEACLNSTKPYPCERLFLRTILEATKVIFLFWKCFWKSLSVVSKFRFLTNIIFSFWD